MMDRKSLLLSTLALMFMVVVVVISDLSALSGYLKTQKPILFGILVIYLALYLLRLFRNFVLFRLNDFTTISLARYLPQGLIAGVIATYGPLKSGELVAMEIYHDAFNIDRGKAFSVIIVGRIIDIVLVLSMVASGVFVLSQEYFNSVIVYLGLLTLFLGVMIVMVLFESVGMTILNGSKRFFIWKFSRIYDFLHQLAEDHYDGLKQMSNWITYVTAILLSLSRWVLELLYFFLIFQSFGFSLTLLQTAPVVGLSYAIGVSSGTPGGLGTSQLTAIGILVFFGISTGTAGLALLIATAISIVVNVGLAGLGFLSSLFVDTGEILPEDNR